MSRSRSLSVLDAALSRRTALLAGVTTFCTACAEEITRRTIGEGGVVGGPDADQADDQVPPGDDAQVSGPDAVNPGPDAIGPRPDVLNPGPDVQTPPPDVQMTVMCPTSGYTAAGRVTDYTVNAAPRFFSSGHFFVLRDAMGFYAVTSVCTHQGCDVAASGAGYRCPCHGATFARDGTSPTSPASRPLRNYAVCIDSTGAVFVSTSMVVAAGTRANPP